MNKPTDFAYGLSNYLSTYLPGVQGAGTNTIKSYRDTFVLFLSFCNTEKNIKSEKLTIPKISKTMVEDFLTWLETERNCSIATRNNRLAAIHAFFRYVQMESPENMLLCGQILAIKAKKSCQQPMNYLTLDGIKAILAQPDTSSRSGYRDFVLLALLYDAGARVQEIADLTVGDVRLDEPATIVLNGKGGKTRIVPLMSQTVQYLKAYIIQNNLNTTISKSYPLFSNRQKQKLTRAGIAYILKKYADLARSGAKDLIPDTISPHSFRHSKAMHLLQAGVNLIYIRDVLGHVSVTTTEIYARADSDMKRKALESACTTSPQPGSGIWHENHGIMDWLHDLCRPV